MKHIDNTLYYHYTTIPACHGILSSRRIWLTDYRYLNDKNEIRQGLKDLFDRFDKEVAQALETAFYWHDHFAHQCILSLSKSPRILSQWRAYANDGTGVAIGFSKFFLSHAELELVDCIYENHENYIGELAEKYSAFARAVLDARKELRAENTIMNWIREHEHDFNAVIRDVLPLKHPAFAEEQEVRALKSYRVGNVKQRLRGDLIVPYHEEVFWDEEEDGASIYLAVREVWLGPKCNELNRDAISSYNLGLLRLERFDCGYV